MTTDNTVQILITTEVASGLAWAYLLFKVYRFFRVWKENAEHLNSDHAREHSGVHIAAGMLAGVCSVIGLAGRVARLSVLFLSAEVAKLPTIFADLDTICNVVSIFFAISFAWTIEHFIDEETHSGPYSYADHDNLLNQKD